MQGHIDFMRFKIQYNDETFYTNNISEEFIQSTFHSQFVKIYYEQNNQNFRWVKIIKGRDFEETNKYNHLSPEFEKSNQGTVFWSNQPISLYDDLIENDIDSDLIGDNVHYIDHIGNMDDDDDDDEFDNINDVFIKECIKRWPLLSHEKFCQLLKDLQDKITY